MKTFISMLRAINVGGQNKIRMEDLCGLYAALGFANVRTYLQSGNVVFDSSENEPPTLARRIEKQIEQSYGYVVPVFLRNMKDFERVIASNPFLVERNEDPTKLHVTFLYDYPGALNLRKLINPAGDGDEFTIGEREIFLFCPNGYGRTKLTNTFFERKLNLPATTRNWNTVNALYRMVKGDDGISPPSG